MVEVMSDINNRINQLIERYGLNYSTFATSIGAKRGTVYNVVGPRRSKPSHALLAAILKKYPGLNGDWLLNGNGDMQHPISDADTKSFIHAGIAAVRKTGATTTSEPPAIIEAAPIDRDEEDAIPFVPIAAEGSYLQGFADEDYIEHMPKFYLPFLGLGQGVYAFQVRGDSMSDRFNNGDVVFGQKVEQNDALRWGEVYVLLCNDGLVVKELRRGPDDQHFTLRSYNEHFDPYDILKSEVRQLYRYQASISFNSSNPNRGGVVNFMKALSEQMSQVQNSLSNLPSAK
jgi:phage repressor protein C with HTH and peptisase S24 domain